MIDHKDAKAVLELCEKLPDETWVRIDNSDFAEIHASPLVADSYPIALVANADKADFIALSREALPHFSARTLELEQKIDEYNLLAAEHNAFAKQYVRETEQKIERLERVEKAAIELIKEVCNDCCQSDFPGECKICEYRELASAVEQALAALDEDHICKTCAHLKGDCGIGIAGDTENAYFCYAEIVQKVGLQDKCHNGKWQAKKGGVER